MNNKIEVLFMHQNFPGQYRSLAPELNKISKYNVRSLSMKEEGAINGIQHDFYTIKNGTSPNIHRLAQEFEAKVMRGEAAALKCFEFKRNGYTPDIIIAHPGWGEALFIKDVWPNVRILSFFEFYYNTTNSDIDFDNTLEDELKPEIGFDLNSKLMARNQPGLMSLLESDEIVSPTKFQANTAPKLFRNKIKIIHDGVNTKLLNNKGDSFVELSKADNPKEKIRLTKKDKILTFVNRNLEPYRGYHIFMRALPEIVERHPDVHILIVGSDGTSYGANAPKGTTHKEIYFNKVKDSLKGANIHFVGRVAYNTLTAMFAVSSAHVYFTYPFVLSWSMLEAMSLEALIVGSNTDPVTEVIKHGKNGLTVDFHDHSQLAKTVAEVLDNPSDYDSIRKSARETIVKNYDLTSICLPQHLKLIESLI